MKPELRLILDVQDLSSEKADALFDAGFGDSHIAKRNGYVCIIIDDHSSDESEATIRAAVTDAQSAGLPILRVEVPAVEQINAELAVGGRE